MKKSETGFNLWPFILVMAFLLGMGANEIAKRQGDNISGPKYKVEKKYEQYLINFVDLAELNGIDLSYIYDYDITIVSEVNINTKSTNVATSYGRDENKIIVVVNEERFMARTEEGRKYVMYHEFGHDILNFPHLENPERGMMEPTAYTGFFKNYDRFSQERQQNYLYTSLKKMFDRYKGDGIQDDNFTIKIEMVTPTIGTVLLYNEETYEFYKFYTVDGKSFTGKFKGAYVDAFLFDDAFVVRGSDGEVLLIQKL